MTLLTLIGVLVLVGILMWGINAAIPMGPRIQNLLNVVVVVFLVLWLLSAFGLFKTLSGIHIPR